MKRTITNIAVIALATILTISCTDNKTSKQNIADTNTTYTKPTKVINQPRFETEPLSMQMEKPKIKRIPFSFDTVKYKDMKLFLLEPEKRQLVKHTGVALFVREQTVKEPTTISITPLPKEELPQIPSNLVNLTNYHNGYRFLPDGQTFEKDITIAMTYDTMNIPFGYGPEDIYTYYYNEQSQQWQQINRDSVDRINHIVYSKTNHFTDYINGVLKVPETSDAMAYTPTSIKDLKAAEPLNGITLMSPPQANNKGTANLSYPITVPQGRRGMQPDLNITYNSSGGNGILGLGWDLSVSCISVETRWGVPLYDDSLETETYLLDGETLVTSYYDENNQFRLNKPTYRKDFEARYQDGKQFYPRVEGAFKKIIRHGTTPTDYWWEVIDKNGTKYFYGKMQNIDGLDFNGVLSDYKGNVAKWCLTRIEDVFGNYISYEYVTKYTQGHNTGGTVGKQIYPKYIKYTGYRADEGSDLQSEDGKYKISFIISELIREDITTSGRYGFKETNAWLLDRIEIHYDNELLKAHYFGYKTGFAGKTLLCNMIDADSLSINQRYYNGNMELTDITPLLEKDIYGRCSEPYEKAEYFPYIEHRFNYETAPAYTNMFTEQVTINTSDDRVTGDIIPFVGLNVGSLEGSLTKSFNIGGAFDVGYDWNVLKKTLSIGGNYMYGDDKSQGLLNYIDLNGDGYVDKIYKKNDRIYYRLRIPNSSNPYFGSQRALPISDFSKSSGYTNTWGIEGDLLVGGFGVNWTDGKTTTSGYFIDLNGDGLIDFVDNEKKYLNQLVSGLPTFTRINEFSNPDMPIQGDCGNVEYVSSGEPVDENIFASGSYNVTSTKCICVDSIAIGERKYECLRDSCWEEVETIEYEYPETFEPGLDNVRIWVAPYTGIVSISGEASLTPECFSLNQLTGNNEGIKLSIDQQGTRLSEVTLKPIESYQSQSFANVSTISVQRGDRIYFRMQSLGKRKYDEVIWNPIITYSQASYTRGTTVINADLSNPLDASGLNMYQFNYSEDFLLSGKQKIQMPFNGKIEITRDIKAPGLKGNVKCYIKKNDSDLIPVFQINNSTNINDVQTFTLNQNDAINIIMLGDGNTNWPAIDATIRIVVVEKTGGPSSDVYNQYSDGVTRTYYYDYYPMIEKRSYAFQKIPSKKHTATSSTTLNITPKLFVDDNSAKTVVMTVKDVYGTTLLSKRFIHFQGGSVPTYSVTVNQNTNYFIDFYVQGPSGDFINNALATVDSIDIEAGLYINYPDSYDKFGINYRNWGQFGYWNHDDESSPIDESLLVLDDAFNQTSEPQPESFTIPTSITSNVNDAYNPLSSTFFLMVPDFKKKSWIGYSDCIYITKDVVGNKVITTYSSTEDVDITDSPLPISTDNNNGVPITTVNKLSFTDNFGFDIHLDDAISIIFPPGVSVGRSFTRGSIRQVSDMMDVNGDKYPDIVSEVNVLYSQSQGGLSNLSRSHAVGGRYSDSTYSTTVGGSFGGSCVVAKKLLSNNPIKSLTTLSAGTGANISNAKTDDNSQYSWVDINGDGLIDKITKDGRVNLNIGNGFLSDEVWYHSTSLRKTRSCGTSIGASVDATALTDIFSSEAQQTILDLVGEGGMSYDELLQQIDNLDLGSTECNVSLNLGIGGTKSTNIDHYNYIDINGDGLVDKVIANNVYYNLGDKFSTSSVPLPSIIETATSYNANITGAITLGFTLGVLPVKIQGNPKGGGARSVVMKEVKWIDMNNDGYLDCVRDGRNDDLYVRYSNLGHVNLLTEVVMPTLSSYKIDYSLPQSSTDCPQRHWTMSSLDINDGFKEDCNDARKLTFEYKNRKYSRYEREDYGYDTVIISEYINPTTIYRKTIESYYNNGYMFKGLNYASTQTNSTLNTKYIEHIRTYDVHEIPTGVKIDIENPQCYGDGYPAISKENILYYDNNQLQIKTEKNYIYTSYGNVTEYQDLGDVTTDEDNIYSYITYSNDEINYFVNLVSDIELKDQQNILLRNRHANYNNFGVMDYLSTFNNGIPIDYYFTYDDYGNITQTTLPPNDLGQNMIIDYEYDNVLHTYPVRVSNSHQYVSTSSYDYRWGKALTTTDIAGNQMHYTFDSRGRTKTIRGPKEIASGQLYTIKYNYWDRVRKEKPRQKVIIPWAKTSNFDPEHTNNNIEIITFADGLGKIIQMKKDIDLSGVEKRSVTGKIMYDALDRPIEEYHPQVEDLVVYDTVFNHLNNSVYPTLTKYDILDRPITITYPNNSTIQNSYGFGQDNNIKRFKTISTDQNGKQTTIYTDHRQLKTRIIAANNSTTQFKFDAIGQLTRSKDPEGQPTSYEYDMLGRRTGRTHPSAGQTQWQYDPVGNITKQIMSSGEEITYNYNFNQLINVNYSDKYWNNVWYEYAGANNGNQTGRLVKQQDATGTQEFHYGNMGELLMNRHTYVVPNSSQAFSLTTEWEYDSWNRVKQIIYPDNEIVTYDYNLGGMLKHIEGDKNGVQTMYIDNINYDHYEQRTDVYNGNQTETHYTYDPVMRRMINLSTRNSNGELLNNEYTYDAVGNILSIDNVGQNPYHQEYTYDDTYQLSTATGNWFNNNQVTYNLGMSYSPSGRITNKNLIGNRIDNSGTHTFSHNTDYNYTNSNSPYAVISTYDNINGIHNNFDWDTKGNMKLHKSPQWGERHFCWTEDNRLQAVKDDSIGAYYNYDASGERNLKLTGGTINVTQNGMQVNIPVLDLQTLYASALVTVNEKGYTKHYFEEGKRICSKIGSGELRDVNGLIEPIEIGYEEQRDIQTNGITHTYEQCMEILPEIKNNDLYNDIILQYESQVNPDEPIFYYHSDHLGSASYITDSAGNETQHLVYLPYGEDWVDKKYNSPQYETPYKFNGKEKDPETGYHYYGARYLNNDLSIWLSVDPMSDERPNLTSYNYCQNNPIMLIDPDGNLDDHYLSEEGKYLGSDGAITDNVRIIPEDTWDNIKTTNQDGTETVNHYVGFANSKSFSKAAINMSEESKLNVFRYFNPTNLPLGSYINAGENYMKFNQNGDPQSILINLKIDDVSNNANNIINSFGHEKDHYDLFQEIGGIEYGKKGNNYIEQRAIRKQMTLPSWEKTTIEYKEAIRDYGFWYGMFFKDFKGF